jgi:hypothetical protein
MQTTHFYRLNRRLVNEFAPTGPFVAVSAVEIHRHKKNRHMAGFFVASTLSA